MYLLVVLYTGVGIPCVLHALTGIKCPGCGVSRMIVALVHLDVPQAFTYNPFLFITGPFLIAYFVCREIKFVKHGTSQMGKLDCFMWIELFCAIVYGVLRNIFSI